MCLYIKLYHFGETVSIVFWTDTWRPTSFCEKIVANRRRGLHTLCLLGILNFNQFIFIVLNIFRY
jgi:diphthine synthase